MSGAAAAQQDPPANPAIDPATAETFARRWGWKPKEDFKGDPAKWVDAVAFFQRGLENPAILLERQQVMDRKMTGLEQRLGQQSTELQAARQAVTEMTEMLRRADERGYKRARAELLEQRDKAIETGDKATVHAIDAGLAELDETKPKPAPTRADPAKQSNVVEPAARVEVQPEVQAFYTDNPWYTTDQEMRRFADRIHVGLFKSDPNLTLAENLKIVADEARARFPDKFRAPPRPNGAAEPEPTAEPEPEPVANPRRGEPAAVTPSADAGGRRQRGQQRTFAAMPQEAKSAFARYKKMLDGKGKPLTEAEYAENYWAQFEEV